MEACYLAALLLSINFWAVCMKSIKLTHNVEVASPFFKCAEWILVSFTYGAIDGSKYYIYLSVTLEFFLNALSARRLLYNFLQ